MTYYLRIFSILWYFIPDMQILGQVASAYLILGGLIKGRRMGHYVMVSLLYE